jgi:hypothetical protein
MIDSIFIVHKKTSDLLLFAEINEEVSIDDLESVLGSVVGYATSTEVGKVKNIGLSQGKFVYGNFDTYYMIFLLGKGAKTEDVKRFMLKISEMFTKKYSDKLENYDGDDTAFSGFTAILTEEINALMSQDAKPESAGSNAPSLPKIGAPSIARAQPNIEPPKVSKPVPKLSGAAPSVPKLSPSVPSLSPKPKEEVEEEDMSGVFGASEDEEPEVKVPAPQVEKPKPLNLDDGDPNVPMSLRKMKINLDLSEAPKVEDLGEMWLKPKPRDMYAEGIPEYSRDEILWNEAEEIKKMCNADYIDGEVAKLEVFIDLSTTHSYRVVIDFREFPEPPKFELPEQLIKELGDPLEKVSYFLRNWDPKVPAHPYELVQELEKILLKYKSDKKLSQTADFESMANTLVLEPLPSFTGLAPLKTMDWEKPSKPTEVPPEAPTPEPEKGKDKGKEKDKKDKDKKEKDKDKKKK